MSFNFPPDHNAAELVIFIISVMNWCAGRCAFSTGLKKNPIAMQ